MNSSVEQFLAARLPFPGLVAWGARLPDRTAASQSYVDWLPVSRTEQVLARLILAADSLQYHQIEPVRLCWTFEHLRFRLGLRPDGVCLMLVEQNQRDYSPAAGDSAFDDFAQVMVP
jgi:hypothetical protein